MTRSADVIIVGGGVIGAACGYYLARKGLSVHVLERRRGIALEATGANAGMIGASTAPPSVAPLMIRGLELLPRLAQELEHPFELVLDGRLHLAYTEDDVGQLRSDVRSFEQITGQQLDLLSPDDLRELEPMLDHNLFAGGILVGGEGHLNPFELTFSLLRGAESSGGQLSVDTEVLGLIAANGRVTGVRTNRGDLYGGAVVIAAGAWAAPLVREVGIDLPVKPGRGQMLITERTGVVTRRTLRAPDIGIRQTVSGNVMLGSTVEYVGFDRSTTPLVGTFATKWLRLMPALQNVNIIRTWSGFRPMSEDGSPIVGAAPGVEGLWLATGHARTGLTWAAVTGEVMANLMTGETVDLDISPISPDRIV